MAYIDTKYLGKCETCRHCIGEFGCNTFCDSGECYSPNLSKIPTADVVEVKHGEWISEGDGVWMCNLCKGEIIADAYGDIHPADDCDWIFCPYCGAKMDGTPRKEV